MLQIKNMLGGGKPEGLYVWKKIKRQISYESTYVSNATHTSFEPTIKSYPFTVYKSKGYTFDETTGEYTLTEPVSETIVSSGNGIIDGTYYGTINSKSSKNMIYPTKSGYGATIELTSNGLNAWTGSSTYPAYWYKSSEIIKTLDETHIVSDKETAYPDGGEKGGYWYEKISNLKFTFGTFTPTSNQQETTIVHGLNAKIRFFGIYTEHIKPTENSLYQVEALSLHRGITYASNGTSTENYNGRVSTTYVLTSGPYWYDQGFKISSRYGIGDVTESSITIFKNNRATNDTSSGGTDAPYFIGGRVHKWIAIADWEV